MTSNEEDADFQKDIAIVQREYVDKVLAHLRGQSDQITNMKQFQENYKILLDQCDQKDNNKGMHKYYKQIIKRYIIQDLIPYTEQGEQGEEFLVRFCKFWTNFAKFAKVIEKLFDFLNRYYLKNQSQPSLGE